MPLTQQSSLQIAFFVAAAENVTCKKPASNLKG